MGVKGLTTYVEGHRHFLQDVKFRDSHLVIDGCSLYFRLYFNHVLDQQHGGDYDTFACILHRFFSALAACNIQPFVVLDGGKDTLIYFKKWISVYVVRVISPDQSKEEHVRRSSVSFSTLWLKGLISSKQKPKHLDFPHANRKSLMPNDIT